MKDENTTDETLDSGAPVVEEAAPRKILLGKRVLRHFQVRSGVQTGAGDVISNSDSIRRPRCVGFL